MRSVVRGLLSGASAFGVLLEANMTSRALVGGLALAAGTVVCICSAQAADLPPAPRIAPMAPVAYVAPVYNWSGFYIGGHLGGGFENSSWNDAFTGGTDSFSK